MVGGKIKRVFQLTDRQSVLVVDDNGDELAVDVVRCDNIKFLPGDSFWWQDRFAYWTAQAGVAIRDVPIKRIGYSYNALVLQRNLSVAGICPSCGNNKQCMHDGNGALWCPVCGESIDTSDRM